MLAAERIQKSTSGVAIGSTHAGRGWVPGGVSDVIRGIGRP